MQCKFCENQTDGRRLRCGPCNTKIRRYRNKLRAIQYLGGECNKCGHKGPHYHFDFHHRDSDDKEFQLGNVANKSWNSIKEELDKCDLLCVFCHRECHLKTNMEFWHEVLRYNGQDGDWLTDEVKNEILEHLGS